MGNETNETNLRSRLISLAHEVIWDMKKMPVDEATDVEILSLLSRAFLDKATAPALEAERDGTFMFSKLDEVGPSFLRSLSAP